MFTHHIFFFLRIFRFLWTRILTEKRDVKQNRFLDGFHQVSLSLISLTQHPSGPVKSYHLPRVTSLEDYDNGYFLEMLLLISKKKNSSIKGIVKSIIGTYPLLKTRTVTHNSCYFRK
jgi:hypothetical protein